MDILKIRRDFPIFSQKPGPEKSEKSGSLIYFDTSATAQKPAIVIEALSRFYTSMNANVHRGLYELGESSTTHYEAVREKVAHFINAKHTEEIIFTKGTTEGINFIAASWAEQHLKQDDEIVLTQAEHHANLLPWQRVAQKTGAKLVFIPLDLETYTFKNPENYITSRTKLLAVTYSSNVLGEVWDHTQQELETLIAQAHSVGARVLIDAAQAVMHRRIDIQQLNPDFLVFSGHKMMGPMGVGVLYIKQALHDDVQPYQVGGSMVFSVSFEGASWAKSPQKFEAGTPPIAEVFGLGAAIEYINKNINFDELQKHEARLCSVLIDGLEKLEQISGIRIMGNKNWLRQHGHLVSFAIQGVHPHDIASYLGAKNIAVRAGHHCAQPLVNLLEVDALLRVSFGVYNTITEVEILLQELTDIVMVLRTQASTQSLSKNLNKILEL